MSEIASVWVSVVPSFKGGQKAIAEEFGAAGDPAGKKAGKGFLGGLGSSLGGVAKIAAGTVGVVGGLLGGMAIKGGIDRALNIEDARAKLKGLGHETQSVDGIMQNALASVSGTAYGLGDAAAVAAGVVAAGVKPGQDLERTLKLVGDAATIAGTDMGSMGSIFNKVASSDMIQGDVLAQLGDAGIPILQLLGEELGVTSEEVRKLASDGEIDFATFQNAMEAGLGGAALASGDTFRGALANTGSAMSRIGETFISPFLGAIQVGLNGAIPMLDGLNKKLKPIMANIGAGLTGGLAAFSAAWAANDGDITSDGFAGAMERIAYVAHQGFDGARGAMAAFSAAWHYNDGDITSTGLAGVMERVGYLAHQAFDEVSGGVSAMVAAFQDGEDHVTSSGFAGILEGIGVVARNVADAVVQGWEILGPTIMSLIPQVLSLASSISPLGLAFQLITPFLPQIATMLMTVMGAIGQVLAVIIPLVETILSALIPVFMQLVGAILPPVIAIIGSLVAALGPLISVLGPILTGVINALMPIVVTVFGLIQTVITTALGVVQGIIGAFSAALSGDWGAFWDSIGSVFTTIVEGIGDFASQYFGELPGNILSALGDLGGLLLDAGGQILSGFLDGLTAGFEKVKDFVGGIGSWIADNKGPKAYDLALLVPAGGWIMSGLEKGIEQSMPSLGSTLGDVSWMIANGIDPGVTAGVKANVSASAPVGALASSPIAGVGAAGSGVAITNNITANDTEGVVQEVMGRLRFEFAKQGVRLGG